VHAYARGFRLVTPDGDFYDGAQYPSGRVVLDHPERGLVAAAVSVDALLERAGLTGSSVYWAPAAASAASTPKESSR